MIYRTVHKRTARIILVTLYAAVLVGTGVGWAARAEALPDRSMNGKQRSCSPDSARRSSAP